MKRIRWPFFLLAASLVALPLCLFYFHAAVLPLVIVSALLWLYDGVVLGEKSEHRHFGLHRKLDLALSASSMGIWEWERSSGRLHWTASLEKMHGYNPGQFPSSFDDYMKTVHPDDRDYLLAEIDRSMAEKIPFAAQYRVAHPDHTTRWIESRAHLVLDRKRQPSGMVGICMEITDNKNLEEAVQFLALASQEFSQSIDSQAFLKKMAEYAVPRFADWCAVDLVDSASGKRSRVAMVHGDRSKVAKAWELYNRYGERQGRRDLVAEAMREKRALIGRMSPEIINEIAVDGEHARMIEEMGIKSFMILPLQTRHGIAGILTFVCAESGRIYTARDLSFAEYLARHAALAIENAWHYRDLSEARNSLEKKVCERTALAENRALKLRELTLMLARSEQNERRRIARVLHDDLQQLLVAAKMGIHQLEGHESEEVRDIAGRIEQLLTESAEVSRSLTVELSPHVLRDGNLRQVMDWLGRWFLDHHGLNVEVIEYDGMVDVAEDSRIFLFQSVKELLLNVVKHAKTRRARIMLAAPANGGTVVSVIDYGQGFGSGNSADDAGSFGLFHIRERLEMLGGRLELDSTPGRGTRVSLWLPPDTSREIDQVSIQTETASKVHEDEKKGGKRILIVDDHKIVREGLVNLLSSHQDLSVVGEAGDGMSAIEQALRLQPEVIVMDISMPRMNGIEATSRIKTLLPSVKVITLSLHDSEDMEERVRQCGSDAYLNKSGPAHQLVETIRGLFYEGGHSKYAKSMD